MSLEITRAPNENKENSPVKDLWQEKFNRQAVMSEEEGEERESEETEQKGKSKNERTANRLEPIPKLGEAAFRAGNQITNALFVLEGSAIVRISVGGAESQTVKLEKLQKLARKALARIG